MSLQFLNSPSILIFRRVISLPSMLLISPPDMVMFSPRMACSTSFKESSSASILTLSMDTSTSSSVSPEMSTEDTSERFSISSCRYSAYSLSLSSS